MYSPWHFLLCIVFISISLRGTPPHVKNSSLNTCSQAAHCKYLSIAMKNTLQATEFELNTTYPFPIHHQCESPKRNAKFTNGFERRLTPLNPRIEVCRFKCIKPYTLRQANLCCGVLNELFRMVLKHIEGIPQYSRVHRVSMKD